MLSSQKELVDNVKIKEPLGSSDHNQMHFNINIKSDRTEVKQCRRDFGKGNYKEIRKRLALIDGNDKMKNKKATECWNIIRGELDSAIDSYVPVKKQGKRSKKKYLSKKAFRKIRHKQNMWRVYTVADRGVSGPWGPKFCGALSNIENQCLPAGGGAGSPRWGPGQSPGGKRILATTY